MGTKITDYTLSPEWDNQLSGISNLCFAPHDKYIDGMRERHVVQYPFVGMIAEGKLSRISGFEDFSEGSVLIFCSYRIPSERQGTKSLDIVVYSSKGSVSLFECKVRAENDGKSDSTAAKKLSCAACQLSEYAKELIAFGNRSLSNPLSCLSGIHYYSNRYRFREFTDLLETELGLKTERQREGWAKRAVESMAEKCIKCGLVFNGPPDDSVAGYGHVDKDIIMDATEWGWHSEFGRLHLFMTDHDDSSFEEL